MSTCLPLMLSCLRTDFCGGWVNGLIWWDVEEYQWGSKIFIEFAGCWPATSLSMWVFCRCFSSILLRQINYLSGFYVDQYSGGKGLTVTWRQILKCDMTRERACIWEREGEHAFVCMHRCVHADTGVCMHVVIHKCFCTHLWPILIAC